MKLKLRQMKANSNDVPCSAISPHEFLKHEKMFEHIANMKNKLFLFLATVVLLMVPKAIFAQSPVMGSTSNFVLFSTNGPLANTGTSSLTGDVGTNNGTCSNFLGVVGVVHTMDVATALCAADLGTLYNQLNTTSATLIASPTLGNNQVITAGAYSITTAATLNGTLVLDGQGNANAVFIIQIQGAFASNTGAVVTLTNNAQACNVFWKVEGSITLGSGSVMKGTFVANNAAININAGAQVEGRALSTAGAVSVYGVSMNIPTGCSSGASVSITTQPTNQAVCDGNAIAFSVVASGSGLTYQWRKGTVNLVNGGNISGVTTATLVINPASVGDVASNYNVVVTGSASPSQTSTSVFLVVNSSPTITTQAINQTNCVGGSASFSVAATGTGLTYQWRIGTVNLSNGGSISGATSAILTINPIALTDAATNYNVVVSGVCTPSVVSSDVTLVVNSPIVVATAPVGQTVCPGGSASFPVTASGTGITYQWRIGTVNLVNGGNISGATSANLLVNPVSLADASTLYNVVISGTCAPAYTSANVALLISTSPTITAALANQTICAGSSVTFPVSASGTGLTYQWRLGTVNISNGGTISGATSANLVINPAAAINAAANYNVVITGACAPAVTSANVSLVVNAVPLISTAPVSVTLCSGSSAGFAVTASGTGITYQWRNGTVNLVNAGTISGATSANLVINPITSADASANYNVVISGVCAPSLTTANVALVVTTSPSITAAIANVTLCSGGSAVFPVTTTGSGLTYQWRLGTVNLVNGGSISGATSSILNINPATVANAATNYNVIVSGVCAPSATSANVTLVVNALPAISTAPVSQTACSGSSVSFPVTASGSGLTYQWRIGTVNLVNAGNISGATSAVLVINPVSLADANVNYNVVVSGLCLPAITSANVALAVNSTPTITAVIASQTVCAGGSVTFPVVAAGTGISYQWRIGTVNLVNGGNISGATSANLTINPTSITDAAPNYNVVITGVCAPSFTSANVALVVNALPLVSTAPVSQTVCEGTSVSFPVTASGTGLTYQWRIGTVNLVNGGTISGATSAILVINPVALADANALYNVIISGVCAPSFTSANVTLGVNSIPTITAPLASQTICAGSSVTFPVAASGTGLTYQWRIGTVNLVNGGNISGATSANLVISAVNTTNTATNYNVVITGVCSPSIVSANVALTVNSLPGAVTVAPNQTVCAGSSVSFPVSTVGTGLTYQWRNGAVNLSNGGNISGATTATLTINPATAVNASAVYNLVITGACSPTITTTNISLVVNALPVIITAPVSQTVCAGSGVSFPVTANGTGLTYQWRVGTVNLTNGGTITGATSSVLTINPANSLNSSLLYNVVISGVCAPSVTSANVSLLVNTSPSITTAAVNQTVCLGNSVTLPVVVTGSGLVYQWRIGTVNLVNGGNKSGVNTPTLTINPVALTDANANYNLVITGLCTPSVVSANISLVVATKAVIKTQPGNQMAYMNGTASFSVLATGTALTYQWRRGSVNLVNGGNISGATSPILKFNPVTYADTAGNYNVIVTGLCLPGDTSINAILWVCYCPNTTGIAKLEKENVENAVTIYPNPFDHSLNFMINTTSKLSNCEVKIFNLYGTELLSITATKEVTTIDTTMLPIGTYVYKIVSEDRIIQSGKLIAQ
ncbi:MAG: ice-binding family protein [bacterium]|nr:ice-binding family protein [bacterium]